MYYRKNAIYKQFKGETNSLPSETIPGDSLTMQEIFRRFATGTLPRISKQPQYLEEDEIENQLNTDSYFDGKSPDLTDIDYSQEHYASLLDSAIQESNREKEKREKERLENAPKPDVSNEPSERSEPIP